MAGRRIPVTVDADTKGDFSTAADGLDKVAKKADDADGSLRKMSKGAQALDDKIGKTAESVKALRSEFERTGDIDLLKDARKLDNVRKNLERLRKDFADAGEESGKTFTAGLQGTLKTPVVGPALIATLTGAAIASAPAIGAAVATGVTLGVGGGALAAGIALGAQDPRVKDAWGRLGDGAKEQLVEAGAVFAPSLVRAADTFGDAFGDRIMPSIRRDFVSLAPLVDKLADGLVGFATNAQPGVDNLIETAGPFIAELARELPNLGNAIDDFFDSVSAGGPGALQFFHDVLDLSQKGIVAAGNATEGLSKGYAFMSGASRIMQGDLTGAITLWEQFGDHGAESSHVFAEAGAAIMRQVRTLSNDLDSATRAAGSLKAVFDALNGGFINSTQAAINAEANIDALTESVKRHGNSLDIDNASGRDNVGIITKGAELARDAAQAKYDETDSLEAAKATYDGYIGKLRTTAGDLGFNKQKTDELFTSISQMPPLKATQISLPGIDTAIEKVIGLQTRLNGMKDRTVTVTTIQNMETGQTRTSVHQSPRFERWGGITEHAQTGLLREAGIFSTASPARYAFAEPATGGEAFVPKNGDRGRSMSILDQAASWYGASVVPHRASGYDVVPKRSGYSAPVTVPSGTGGGGGTLKLDITLRNQDGQVMHRELVDYALKTGRTPAALFPDQR